MKQANSTEKQDNMTEISDSFLGMLKKKKNNIVNTAVSITNLIINVVITNESNHMRPIKVILSLIGEVG